jgi:hypothetical protein
VESIPREIPPMIMVAGPVKEVLARFLVGLYESDVKYSVKKPIRIPASSRR